MAGRSAKAWTHRGSYRSASRKLLCSTNTFAISLPTSRDQVCDPSYRHCTVTYLHSYGRSMHGWTEIKCALLLPGPAPLRKMLHHKRWPGFLFLIYMCFNSLFPPRIAHSNIYYSCHVPLRFYWLWCPGSTVTSSGAWHKIWALAKVTQGFQSLDWIHISTWLKGLFIVFTVKNELLSWPPGGVYKAPQMNIQKKDFILGFITQPSHCFSFLFYKHSVLFTNSLIYWWSGLVIHRCHAFIYDQLFSPIDAVIVFAIIATNMDGEVRE